MGMYILLTLLFITFCQTSYILTEKISIPQAISNNPFMDFYIKGRYSFILRQWNRFVGWNKNISNYPSYIIELENNNQSEAYHLFGETYSLSVKYTEQQISTYAFQTQITAKYKSNLTQLGIITQILMKDQMIVMIGIKNKRQNVFLERLSPGSVITTFSVPYNQEIKGCAFMNSNYYSFILKIQQRVFIKQFNSQSQFECGITVTNIKDDFIKYYSLTRQVDNVPCLIEMIMLKDTTNNHFVYKRILKQEQSRKTFFNLVYKFQDNDVIAIDFYNQTHTYQLSNNKVVLRALQESPLLIISRQNDSMILNNGSVYITSTNIFYANQEFKEFVEELMQFNHTMDPPHIDLPFIRKGYFVTGKSILLLNDYAIFYDLETLTVFRLWQTYEFIDATCEYGSYIAAILKSENNYLLTVYTSTDPFYNNRTDEAIINYPDITKIKLQLANDASGNSNVMIIIKFANGTLLNELWNVNANRKLNKIYSFNNKISLNYAVSRLSYYLKGMITYYYVLDQLINPKYLLTYSVTGNLVLNITLPNQFKFFKLYSNYIFLFTFDRLCYIYYMQKYNQGIPKFVQTVYFSEMNLSQVNQDTVNIFEDNDKIDQRYGKNFIIYFTIFNTSYYYKTNDPLKNMTLQKYSINENNIEQLKVKPITIQQKTSFCYMLQNYMLIFVKLSNIELLYQSYNLSLVLAGSKNISIKINGDNILIKYTLNNRDYFIKYDYNSLNKVPIQNNWSYNENKIFPQFDINKKGEIVLYTNSNLQQSLYYFQQNPKTYKRPLEYEVNSLSKNGKIWFYGKTQSPRTFIYYKLTNNDGTSFTAYDPYNMSHVHDLGRWIVFSNSTNFFTYDTNTRHFSNVQQLDYKIKEIKILEQKDILVVTQNSMLIRNNFFKMSSQTYIFTDRDTGKLLFDFYNEVIAYSLDYLTISMYFYNGTFISSIKMTHTIQKIRLNQQRQLYVLLNNSTILAYSFIDCPAHKIESNGVCICSESMILVNNYCLCPEGKYNENSDNNNCLQCSFLCSSCTSSGLSCQAYNTSIVLGMVFGVVLVITSVIVLIICIKRYRKRKVPQESEKSSLLSDEKIPRNRSDIYDQ